jgi:hypothetical protein
MIKQDDLDEANIILQQAQVMNSLISLHNDEKEDPFTTRIGLEIIDEMLAKMSLCLNQ